MLLDDLVMSGFAVMVGLLPIGSFSEERYFDIYVNIKINDTRQRM